MFIRDNKAFSICINGYVKPLSQIQHPCISFCPGELIVDSLNIFHNEFSGIIYMTINFQSIKNRFAFKIISSSYCVRRRLCYHAYSIESTCARRQWRYIKCTMMNPIFFPSSLEIKNEFSLFIFFSRKHTGGFHKCHVIIYQLSKDSVKHICMSRIRSF